MSKWPTDFGPEAAHAASEIDDDAPGLDTSLEMLGRLLIYAALVVAVCIGLALMFARLT